MTISTIYQTVHLFAHSLSQIQTTRSATRGLSNFLGGSVPKFQDPLVKVCHLSKRWSGQAARTTRLQYKSPHSNRRQLDLRSEHVVSSCKSRAHTTWASCLTMIQYSPHNQSSIHCEESPRWYLAHDCEFNAL
jgi:hypothetical protein